MEDKDIMQEIAELRRQLEAVSAARMSAPKEEQASPEQGVAAEDDTGEWLRGIMKQVEELFGGLDLHINDVPATKALFIFALGVLMGRTLSRRG